MIVLVRWCYNVDCHSVGRVPSSYPRGVRRPTAPLCTMFYPTCIPFLFVLSVCLGLVRFVPSVSCPLSLSPMSSPLLFLCIVCSLRLPLLFETLWATLLIKIFFYIRVELSLHVAATSYKLQEA